MAANFKLARSVLLALAVILAWATPQAMAQTYYWDVSTNSGIQNGDGIWGTDNFWASTAAGTNNVAWSNNVAAWLGGTATAGQAGTPSGNFTITVSGTQQANTIRQIQNGSGNFTLTGGEIQANSFRVDTNTLTINSIIGSYTNVANARVDFSAQPAAGALLILGGNNTLTNNVGITGATSGGGTVRLNHQNALGLGSSVLWVHNTSLDLNGLTITNTQTITVNNSRTAFLLNSAAANAVWSGNVMLTNTTGNVGFRAGGTNGEVEVSGVISGTSNNSVQSLDGGRLRLSGANTYDGVTSVRDNSTLIVNNNSALGSTVSGTTISTGATLDLNGFNVGNEAITLQQPNSKLANSNTSTAATVGGAVTISNSEIGGPGNLTLMGVVSSATTMGFSKTGTGTLTLSGANTYSGTTTVSEGTLALSGSGTLGAGTNALTISGGNVDLGGQSRSVGAFTLGTGTLANGTLTATSYALTNAGSISASLAGSGGLTKTGAGTATLSGSNSYSGTTTISAGSLRMNNANALGSGTSVHYTATSTLDLNGFDVSGKTITASSGATGFLDNTSTNKSVWSGTVDLSSGTGTLRAGGTGAELEISGVISGTNALQSLDNGVLRLTGDNTYTGGTSLRAGSTLIVGHTNALGLGSATIFIGSSTLDLNGFDIGDKTLRFQQNNSRLVNDNTSTAAFHSGSIEMQDNRNNSQVGGAGNLTLSGDITVINTGIGGGLTKVGTGTLILEGNNTYTGQTAVTGGVLQFGNGGSVAGNITITNAALAINRTDASTLSNIVGGTGSLTKAGSGTLTLTALNSYSGGTFLDGGWLVAGHTNAFGTGSITVGLGTTLNLTNFNIANLVINNGGTILSTGTLDDVIATNGTTDIGGSNSTIEEIGGTAVVNVTGSSVVVSNTTGGTLNADGSSVQVASVSGGTVNLGGSSAVVTAASGGTVNANASGATLGTVSGTAAVNVAGTDARVATLSGGSVAANASGLVVTNYNGGNIAVSNGVTVGLRSGSSSGVISGQGGVAKQSADTLTLSGVNTLSGATTVEEGKLVVNGSLNNSAVTVQSGAILGGSGSIGTLTLNGILAPGNSPGQTDAGTTFWNQGGSYDWEIFNLAGPAGNGWDLLNITNGSLNLNGITAPGGFTINLITLSGLTTQGALSGFSPTATYTNWLIASAPTINGFSANLFTLNTNSFVGATGTFAIEQRAAGGGQGLFLTYNNGGGEPVPEPGTWAAAALLALGAAYVRRRRKKEALAQVPSAGQAVDGRL